jgi:hypothetical protein
MNNPAQTFATIAVTLFRKPGQPELLTEILHDIEVYKHLHHPALIPISRVVLEDDAIYVELSDSDPCSSLSLAQIADAVDLLHEHGLRAGEMNIVGGRFFPTGILTPDRSLLSPVSNDVRTLCRLANLQASFLTARELAIYLSNAAVNATR